MLYSNILVTYWLFRSSFVLQSDKTIYLEEGFTRALTEESFCWIKAWGKYRLERSLAKGKLYSLSMSSMIFSFYFNVTLTIQIPNLIQMFFSWNPLVSRILSGNVMVELKIKDVLNLKKKIVYIVCL